MLADAFTKDVNSIKVSYPHDSKLFNFQRLQLKNKVEGELVHDFWFVDDCALNAASETKMQQSMNQFSATWANFGLIINTKETLVLYQSPPHHPYVEP